MAQNKTTSPQKKESNTGKIIGIIVAILVLAGIIIAIILLMQNCSTQDSETGGSSSPERERAAAMGLLPGMTDEEIEDRLNRKVAESMMNVSFNPTPEFEDGKSAGNLRIENIPGNNYAFTVTIVRADTGEQILKTGLIDPGYYVQDIKLDKELPKGEYPCVATFTGYDPQTLQEIGETGSQLVITIKN